MGWGSWISVSPCQCSLQAVWNAARLLLISQRWIPALVIIPCLWECSPVPEICVLLSQTSVHHNRTYRRWCLWATIYWGDTSTFTRSRREWPWQSWAWWNQEGLFQSFWGGPGRLWTWHNELQRLVQVSLKTVPLMFGSSNPSMGSAGRLFSRQSIILHSPSCSYFVTVITMETYAAKPFLMTMLNYWCF